MELIKLFSPITINGLTIPNRIVMPSMGLGYTFDYSFNEKYAGFYRERAKGGVGLMTIGPVGMDKNGSLPIMLGLLEDRFIGPLAAFVKELHETTPAKIAIQFMHMGRNAFSVFHKVPPLAPSAVPSPIFKEVPKVMTLEDIEEVKESYAAAAIRAREAGFDAVEILACTGYLICEFLSPVTNLRGDMYGGCLDNRMRFGLEVISKTRAALGKDFPMGIRIAGNDFMDGGLTNVESALFAAQAEKAGVDFINVTGGWHETAVPQLPTGVPPGAFVYLAKGIKEKVGVPVFASNRLGDPFVAERALRSGSCDMVCMGRPLIADPELPNKAKQGRFKEIVSCISCNQGCFDTVFVGGQVTCVLNPRVGRENDFPPGRAKSPKKVLVAGGGPAGMEFALTAAQRGHDVTLCEKQGRLGGQINVAKAAPGKDEFEKIISSMQGRMELAGVKVRLSTEVSPELVAELNPDVLVVATGARPIQIKVPGVDLPHVVGAWDVLEGRVADIGKNVVVVGGSATGCETAHLIAAMDLPDDATCSFLMLHEAESPEFLRHAMTGPGRKVTVVDMVPRLAENMGKTTRWPLLKAFNLLGIVQKPGTKLVKILPDAVVVDSGNGPETIPADTVVMAVGSVPENRLKDLKGREGMQVLTIGDARSPRKISDAVREGFEGAFWL